MKPVRFAMSYRLWSMAVVSVITISLMVSQYYLNYRVVKELHLEQIKESNTIIESNARTMMQFPLVVGDKQEVARLAADLLEHDLLWAIEVRDESGNIIYRKESDNILSGLTLDKKTLTITDSADPIKHELFGDTSYQEEKVVGEIGLYFTNQTRLDQQEKILHSQTLISTAVIILAGLVILYLVLNISSFVERAKERMRLIRQGAYDIKMERSRIRELNEMAEGVEAIAKAFNERKIELEKQTTAAEKSKLLSEQHSKFKTEMMRLISHELRTPIHVIVNLMGNMDNASFTNIKEREAKLRMVKQASSELLAVVDELVDIKIFEEGSVHLTPQLCNIDSVMTEICERLSPKFSLKPIDFELQTLEKDLSINAIFDKGKFERILTNLIINAHKFTVNGKVTVTWQIQRNDDPYLIVCVKDTGIGISKDDISHIFDQFYQVSPISKRRGGMGIGLTWVDKLLRIMDGNIDVVSEEGLGSKFTVSIPIRLSNQTITKPEATPAYIQKHEYKALIIDDREDNCIVLKGILEPVGINTAFGQTKGELIKHINGQQFDFILLDYHMPEHDGEDLARVVRASKTNENSIIVCITADTTITTNDQFLDSGLFDGIITKPIEPKALIERLEQLSILKNQMRQYHKKKH